MELHYERFGAQKAIAEVLVSIEPLATARQTTIDNRVVPELIVYADRLRFKQILYNLISNAVKFTPEGGKVGIESGIRGGAMLLAVTDTGAGVPRKARKAIFDSGLGLSTTRRLVEMHGGTIWVESWPGKGSRFAFTLPAEASGARPAPL